MERKRRLGTSIYLSFGWIPLAGAGLYVLSQLWAWAQQAPHLPRWDMAKYGAAASRMQQAMESFDLWTLLQEIHQLSSWPFVFSLSEAMVFQIWGHGFEIARSFMVVLLGLTWFLAAKLAHQLGEEGLGGSLLVWWTLPILLTSPMLHLYGVLNMLEIPGALLTLLCFLLYGRATEEPHRSGPWWSLGIASCVFFFCKYNYGLMWLAALGLAEARRRCGSWRSAVSQASGWVFHRPIGSWQVFVTAVVMLLVWIRLQGGLELQLGSVEVRATSIGNPVYGLLLLQVGRLALLPGVRRRALHGWRRVSPSSRILGWSLGCPILIWMLLPPHCKDFFGFVENRSSGLSLWSLESTWFYGHSLGEDFLAWPRLTWPILLLALWGGCRLARMSPIQRVLALYVVIHSAALWAHPYKLPRFAVTWFIPLVSLAAWGALDLLRTVAFHAPQPLASRGHRSHGWAGLALAGTILVVLWQSGSIWNDIPGPGRSVSDEVSDEVAWTRFEEQTVPASVRDVLDRVLEASQGSETALLGTWNLFSPALVEWRHIQRGSSRDVLWIGPDLERRRRKGAPWPPRVIVLEMLPNVWRSDLAQAHLVETERHRQWAQTLKQSGAFKVVLQESWQEAGYRIEVLEQVSGL